MQTVLAGAHQPPAYLGPLGALESPRIHDVVLHHLRHPADISGIVHLREEIDLSVHTAAGRQQFERLEKKETSAGSSAVSSWRAS